MLIDGWSSVCHIVSIIISDSFSLIMRTLQLMRNLIIVGSFYEAEPCPLPFQYMYSSGSMSVDWQGLTVSKLCVQQVSKLLSYGPAFSFGHWFILLLLCNP